MSAAVGSCGWLVFVALLLLLLLISGNGGVQAKAIGNVATKDLINERVTSPTTELLIKRTTTDDVPIFDRKNVALSVPDGLFASTANLTLRLRDLLGQLILRSATRFAQLMRFMQPLFGGHLVIEIPKELDKI